MTIDDIITQAQATINQLYEASSTKQLSQLSIDEMVLSGEGITFEQKTFFQAQLARLRLEVKAIHFAPENNPLTASDFLRAGIKHMEDRAITYDAPGGERSMGKTVAMFNILRDCDLSEEDGWALLGLLKTVRSFQGAFKADSYEDEASYAALRGECAARERGGVI